MLKATRASGRRVQEGQEPGAGEEKSAIDLRIEELQRKVDQLLRDIRRFRGGGGGDGLEIPKALTDERVDELMATLMKNMSEIGEEDTFTREASLHFWRFTNRLKLGILGRVQQAKVLAYLEGVAKDHPEAENLIEQQIFTVNRLMIGRQAPNIEGRDTTGIVFDLEDYRGKVVALYFSVSRGPSQSHWRPAIPIFLSYPVGRFLARVRGGASWSDFAAVAVVWEWDYRPPAGGRGCGA